MAGKAIVVGTETIMENTPEQPKETAAATEEPEEELLYHYTDQAGLDGILASDCMRATHYKFLNDFSECLEALELFAAQERQSMNCSTTSKGSSIRQYLSQNTINELQTLVRSAEIYSASFAVDSNPLSGDRLSQWRGYAKGTQGFSLGFKKNAIEQCLTEFAKLHNVNRFSDKCLYGETDESREKRKVIISVVRGFDSQAEQENFLRFIAIFKNVGFYEESEWKILIQGSPESMLSLVQFRDGQFGRTPFIEIPLGLRQKNSPLQRIVVGPSQNKEQVAACLRIDLRKLGMQHVDVDTSQIPYRSW